MFCVSLVCLLSCFTVYVKNLTKKNFDMTGFEVATEGGMFYPIEPHVDDTMSRNSSWFVLKV